MARPRRTCPKCQGRLYLEQDGGGRFALPPEWVCFQCGWRRTYTPKQFEQTFVLSAEQPKYP